MQNYHQCAIESPLKHFNSNIYATMGSLTPGWDAQCPPIGPCNDYKDPKMFFSKKNPKSTATAARNLQPTSSRRSKDSLFSRVVSSAANATTDPDEAEVTADPLLSRLSFSHRVESAGLNDHPIIEDREVWAHGSFKPDSFAEQSLHWEALKDAKNNEEKEAEERARAEGGRAS